MLCSKHLILGKFITFHRAFIALVETLIWWNEVSHLLWALFSKEKKNISWSFNDVCFFQRKKIDPIFNDKKNESQSLWIQRESFPCITLCGRLWKAQKNESNWELSTIPSVFAFACFWWWILLFVLRFHQIFDLRLSWWLVWLIQADWMRISQVMRGVITGSCELVGWVHKFNGTQLKCDASKPLHVKTDTTYTHKRAISENVRAIASTFSHLALE